MIDTRKGPKEDMQNIDSDESYQLEVEDGQIRIWSDDRPYGAFHGLETFL